MTDKLLFGREIKDFTTQEKIEFASEQTLKDVAFEWIEDSLTSGADEWNKEYDGKLYEGKLVGSIAVKGLALDYFRKTLKRKMLEKAGPKS